MRVLLSSHTARFGREVGPPRTSAHAFPHYLSLFRSLRCSGFYHIPRISGLRTLYARGRESTVPRQRVSFSSKRRLLDGCRGVQSERRLYELRDQLKVQFRATQKAQINERKAADSKRRLTSWVTIHCNVMPLI